MEQDPATPQQPTEGPAGHNNLDLSKILLPKKDGPSLDSAQRVNAGVLVEREAHATLTKTPEENTPVVEPAVTTETPVVEKKPESMSVQPLQTYRSDIEHLVEKKNVSVVSIAAAEATRRGNTPLAANEPSQMQTWLSTFKNATMIIAGVLLLAGVAGLVAFITYSTPSALPVAKPIPAVFFSTDTTTGVYFYPEQISRTAVMSQLESAKKNVHLPLGLMARLFVGVASSSAPEGSIPDLMDSHTLLSTLAPGISDTLLRTIDPQQYILGIHSYDENDPFLILHVDSYDQSFSGMLAWEATMEQDLLPLFERTPSPTIGDVPVAATSTPLAIVTGGNFVDQVVENHDSRVVQDAQGNIILLWTYLDRSTIAITNNAYTLREIISRFQNNLTATGGN